METTEVQANNRFGEKSTISLDSSQIEKITFYLKGIEEKYCKPSKIAKQILTDVNSLVQYHFADDQVVLYGSCLSGFDFESSNINLALMSLEQPTNTGLAQLSKLMYEEMELNGEDKRRYSFQQFKPARDPKTSRISFYDFKFRKQCELVYMNETVDNAVKLNKLLRKICDIDSRVKTLILSARLFAKKSDLHNTNLGRMHIIGFSLMMVYFLQQFSPPVLPTIKLSSDTWGMQHNNFLTLGNLWLEFLKFYSQDFDWENHVVCITSKSKVSKKDKSWENQLIAIEDPFTKENIAKSVKMPGIAEYIIYCFKTLYENTLSPAKDAVLDSTQRDSEGYSLNSCIHFQEKLLLCKDCDEIEGFCMSHYFQ